MQTFTRIFLLVVVLLMAQGCTYVPVPTLPTPAFINSSGSDSDEEEKSSFSFSPKIQIGLLHICFGEKEE